MLTAYSEHIITVDNQLGLDSHPLRGHILKQSSHRSVMLCGIPHPSSHSDPHHHRFLRSFRSHKSLRSRINEDSMHHYGHGHQPSGASSLGRPSLESNPRPSTSSRSDISIDWDPLRLHPTSSTAPGPAPPLQDSSSSSSSGSSSLRHARSNHSLGGSSSGSSLRHARSSHSLGGCSSGGKAASRRHQSCANTVIYDGFDFGFDNTPTPPTAAAVTAALHQITSTNNGSIGMRRPPSPTPSDASSECSLSFSSTGSAASDGATATYPSGEEKDEMGLCLGLAPAPAIRSRPRPRPRHHDDGAPGLDDAAVAFLRRGGWKRRGIVFVNSEAPLAGEEESFEI